MSGNKSNTREVIEEVEESENKATPFVKWAGGKRSIVPILMQYVPNEWANYYEPFIGGGALFFENYNELKLAFLSDTNFDLITAYKVIQKEPEKLIRLLKTYAQKHSEIFYYDMRKEHNLQDAIEVAARCIYLNKTCFNGLWRVNSKGEFNTPIGSYTNPGICKEDNIMACHYALEKASIFYGDFLNISAKSGDFVYFDPPYHPTDETSFTAYSILNFTEKDQIRLRDFIISLHKKEVKIMLSNSNTLFINDLYKSKIFTKRVISAPRMVNCKPGGRGNVEEILITNY